MLFACRCAFWLAIVFMLLPWREDAPAPAWTGGQKPSAQKLLGQKPLDKAQAAMPRNRRAAAPAGSHDADVLTTLARAATDKLTQAAREHCSAHPLDCLSYFGMGAPPEPRHR